MHLFTQYSFFSQGLAFVSLAFCLVSVMTGLNIYWRSHKMLRVFTVYSIISVGIFAVRKAVGTFGLNNSSSWVAIAQYFDLFQSFFFMLATIEFYRIIRRLDGENPPKKEHQ